MSKLKIFVVTIISLIIIIVTTFSIILSSIDETYFKCIKYIDKYTETSVEILLDDYNNIESDELLYYIDLLNVITDNLSEEEVITFINQFDNINVNIFDRYFYTFKYISYLDSSNEESDSNEFPNFNFEFLNNKEFLVYSVELIYDLSNRINNYTIDQINTLNSHIYNLINAESVNDISLVELKSLLNVFGDLTFELKNINNILAEVLSELISTKYKILSQTDNVFYLVSNYLKQLTSNDMLNIIDVLRTNSNDILIYFLNELYLECINNNIYNEINIELIQIEIVFNLDVNIMSLCNYIYNNKITKFELISDDYIKEDILYLINELNFNVN